jgi:hypothetical protein
MYIVPRYVLEECMQLYGSLIIVSWSTLFEMCAIELSTLYGIKTQFPYNDTLCRILHNNCLLCVFALSCSPSFLALINNSRQDSGDVQNDTVVDLIPFASYVLKVQIRTE